MELLNLDTLVEVKRQVRLLGEDYDIADQSVQQMLNAVKLAKAAEVNANDPEAVVNAMIDAAQSIIPGCSREKLVRLRISQLRALMEFAGASDEEVMAGSTDSTSDEVPEQGKT